jgi:hypothetical protein
MGNKQSSQILGIRDRRDCGSGNPWDERVRVKPRWNFENATRSKRSMCRKRSGLGGCIVELPEHAIVRRRSVFSSFFAFFEIFRLANENQQTQNKSTFRVTRHADCPLACEASETKRSKGAKVETRNEENGISEINPRESPRET